jgi:hypothetical protein
VEGLSGISHGFMQILLGEKQVMAKLERIIESLFRHITNKVTKLENITSCAWINADRLQLLKVYLF